MRKASGLVGWLASVQLHGTKIREQVRGLQDFVFLWKENGPNMAVERRLDCIITSILPTLETLTPQIEVISGN